MRLLRLWAQRRDRPERFRLLRQLLAQQRLDRERLSRRQQEDFSAIVRFAATHTDYYARRFAGRVGAGTHPIDPETLPLLTRADVVRDRQAMLAREVDRDQVKVGHTGGSTGTTMTFYYDDAKHELMLAGMMRGFMMSGWRPGQKVLYLWGAERDAASGGVFAHRGNRLLDAEKTLAAFELSPDRLRTWAQTVSDWRPVLLYGYASVLAELARFVVDNRLAVPRSLIGVYSTAEPLQAWQRELMQQAFGCQVFDQYGCREVPNIAWECRAGNMHVFSDMVRLESVVIDGQDRLVVTSLTNRLMPFIRYDVGDTGRLLDTECDCGLPFPLMRTEVCRHNDLIVTPDGRRLHPAYFNRLLYGSSEIRRYQWVQTAVDCIALNLEGERRLPDSRVGAIRAALQRDVDPRVNFAVNYLDRIPRTASGKHRFVIGLGGHAADTG